MLKIHKRASFLTEPLRSLTAGENGDFRQWVILPSRSQSFLRSTHTTTIEATCKEQLRRSSTTEDSGSSRPRMEKKSSSIVAAFNNSTSTLSRKGRVSSLRWNAGIRGREPSMCEPVGLELQLHLHWTKGTDVCPIAVMLGPPAHRRKPSSDAVIHGLLSAVSLP